MLSRTLVLPLALGLLALAGCSGVSVQTDEPEHALPPSVSRVVVVPDGSWAHEDHESIEFLKQVVARLRVRSAVRDYGAGFELANENTLDLKTLEPGRDAVWRVSRCDFNPRASVHHTSPGAEAAPELEDEARAAAARLEVSEEWARPAPTVRSFTFSIRGFIRTPASVATASGDRPLRVISRVALSGDCDFDEALGSDDEALWFRDTLSKIADSLLDHLPRRAPGAGEIEEDDEGPIHGGLVPGEPMPGEFVPDEKVHGELDPKTTETPAIDGPTSPSSDERK